MMLQGHEEWFLDRCGKFTASRLEDILAISQDKWKVIRPTGTVARSLDSQEEGEKALAEFRAKAKKDPDKWKLEKVPGAPLKAFDDYLAEVLCEQLTGEPNYMPDTYQMRWGHDMEPEAMSAYEIKKKVAVKPCGFVSAPAGSFLAGIYGASPDGLVRSDGQVEIKCPVNSTRHLRCFISGFPDEHMPQIQGQLLATGRSWCDFISYDPRMPKHLQLFTWKVLPDPEWQDKIIQGVLKINKAMQQVLADLPQEE